MPLEGDLVRLLKLETSDEGSQTDQFMIEINPTEDYSLVKGIAFRDIHKYIDTDEEGLHLKDTFVERHLKDFSTALGDPMYTTICGYTGTANVGRYLEFHRGIGSNQSPFIIPDPSHLVSISVAVSSLATCTFTVTLVGTGSGTYPINIETLSLSNEYSNSKSGLYYELEEGIGIEIQLTSGLCKNPVFNLFIKPDFIES